MKIVHAVYSLDMGGAEVLVRQLCQIQRAAGHEVSVFSYARLGVVGEALRADGFAVYVPGEAHPLRTMARYLRRFLEMKPDVVHCHNAAPTIHAAVSARLAGVARVISTRHRLEPLPYNMSVELKYSATALFCDWIVGICEMTCIALRGAPLASKEKIVRVYNGTTAVVRVGTETLGKRGFTIVFVGRVAPEKDLGTLIRAVALALPRVPGLDFWIVGGGSSRPELEALARELGVEEHVRFWGQQMDVAPFFSAADAFVMSSVTEGLPMSLLQAMSLGVPAVSTDVDGNGEVIRYAGSGLLAPIGDAPALAEALVKMACDGELRGRLSRAAAAVYEREFTLERMNAGYMALYNG